MKTQYRIYVLCPDLKRYHALGRCGPVMNLIHAEMFVGTKETRTKHAQELAEINPGYAFQARPVKGQ